jgi:hypothetical protein
MTSNGPAPGPGCYTDRPERPHARGMAIRLANGNILANYGTGGTIRAPTPRRTDGVPLESDTPGLSEFYSRMVGHNVLIEDLYALNGGGPE